MLIKNSSFPLRDKYRWKIKNQEESVGMHGGMLVCTSPQQSSQHWYTHLGVRLSMSHADRADTGGKTRKCRLERPYGKLWTGSVQKRFCNLPSVLTSQGKNNRKEESCLLHCSLKFLLSHISYKTNITLRSDRLLSVSTGLALTGNALQRPTESKGKKDKAQPHMCIRINEKFLFKSAHKPLPAANASMQVHFRETLGSSPVYSH